MPSTQSLEDWAFDYGLVFVRISEKYAEGDTLTQEQFEDILYDSTFCVVREGKY